MEILYVLENDGIHEIPVSFGRSVGSRNHPLPGDIKDYFLEMCPGPISQFDTDYVVLPILTEKGIMNMAFDIFEPYPSLKFNLFVTTEEWSQKKVTEIPGIDRVYRPRLRANLKAYCSVSQLSDMLLYWMRKNCLFKFFKLLHWATAADNSNGYWHITHTFQAFWQKHVYMQRMKNEE
ncbi:uncharacterized protein [Mytilus edulis]|uniref:uncharacterized protein n=1 Tax=Mytilus edulis TaxID=6550 RepID=UPI0039F110E8